MDAKDTELFLELLQQLQYEDDFNKGGDPFNEAFRFVRETALRHFESDIQKRVAERSLLNKENM